MTSCLKCGHDPDARIVRSWSFHVPRQVRSGNAHVHNVGTARFTYKRERDAWCADVRALMHVHGVTKATSRRRVTLTRIIGYRQRAFDRDNLATGLKPALDALVLCGALLGDSHDRAEVHYAQEKRDGFGGKHGGGLVVLLEELGLPLTAADVQHGGQL